MTDERKLTAGEREALRALAARVPAVAADEEELTVRRLKSEHLLGSVRQDVAAWPRTVRVSLAAAAAIVIYLAGVYSGRAFHAGASATRVPATQSSPNGSAQSNTVASRPASDPTTIIRF